MHYTGSPAENPIIAPVEPEEQLKVQPQEVPEADEEDVEELPECPFLRERQAPENFSLGLQLLN
jgi:hypothetical protein